MTNFVYTPIDVHDDLAGWTTSGTDADSVIELVSSHHNGRYAPKNGSAGIRLWKNAVSGVLVCRKNISWSFAQDDNLCMAVYVPQVNTTAGSATGLDMYFNEGANYTGGARLRRLFDGGYFGRPQVGWNLFPIHFGDCATAIGTPAQNMTWQTYNINCIGTASYVREFIVDSVGRYRAKPAVCITIDDGEQTARTVGHAVAAAAGVPTTQFIAPHKFGASGFVTPAQVLQMYAEGSEIGAHSFGIGTWNDNDWDIAASVNALEQTLGLPILTASWPEGDYGTGSRTDELIDLAQAAGLRLVRNSDPGIVYRGFFNPYMVPRCVSLSNTGTLANAQAAIQRAIKTGGVAVITAHKFGAVADSITFPTTDYETLISYIANLRNQGLVDVIRMSDLVGQRQRSLVS